MAAFDVLKVPSFALSENFEGPKVRVTKNLLEPAPSQSSKTKHILSDEIIAIGMNQLINSQLHIMGMAVTDVDAADNTRQLITVQLN